MDNIKRRRLKIRLAVVAAFVLFIVTALVPSLEPFFSRKFDSERWRVGGEFDRGMMARDLYESRLLTGKGRGEVERLLGKADYGDEQHMDYTVDMGSRVFYSKWLWHVIVRFDERGVVNEATLSD